jgi:hypothetical protein
MVLAGVETIAVGCVRIWRKRVPYVALCSTAVLFGWLAIRLWMTYLPAQADDVVRLDTSVGQNVAIVQRAAGDLLWLEERARRTAQAVLPSVVAVRNPEAKPSEVARHQKNYASGVIITSDGLVLSQWHVSHGKDSEDGDGATSRVDSSSTYSAGERTTVILHDGRECPAELLGANRTQDVSLLRLLEPGPYPHVPIRATTPVEVGDWVFKIGHPLGYRKGRSAPVRLGRVICGTQEFFGTDCMVAGGDSGGPYFNLDGQLLGIVHGGDGRIALMHHHDASFRVRGAHCGSYRTRNRSYDRQGRSARRHGHPGRLRSEVIASFAGGRISRKLGAGAFRWEVAAWSAERMVRDDDCILADSDRDGSSNRDVVMQGLIRTSSAACLINPKPGRVCSAFVLRRAPFEVLAHSATALVFIETSPCNVDFEF